MPWTHSRLLWSAHCTRRLYIGDTLHYFQRSISSRRLCDGRFMLIKVSSVYCYKATRCFIINISCPANLLCCSSYLSRERSKRGNSCIVIDNCILLRNNIAHFVCNITRGFPKISYLITVRNITRWIVVIASIFGCSCCAYWPGYMIGASFARSIGSSSTPYSLADYFSRNSCVAFLEWWWYTTRAQAFLRGTSV